MTEATNQHIERERLLSSEEDDTRKQYHHLPVGIWFIERLGKIRSGGQKEVVRNLKLSV